MSVFDVNLFYNIHMNNKAFKKLVNSNDTYIIHYASNGIYEFGSSAQKISCIAVYGTNNEISERFFIQDFLEGNSIEQAERIILQNFADFLAKNENIKFVHWGMNSDGFGFRAISARCSDLGMKIREIPSENRIDLSEIVSNIAGKRLSIKQILMMNSCISEDFMSGKDEVECYNKGKYERIFNSVKAKIVGFSCIIDRIINDDLETEFQNNYSPMPHRKEKEQALKEIAEYREQFFKNRREIIKKLKAREERYQQQLLAETEIEYEYDAKEDEAKDFFAFSFGNFFCSSDPLLTVLGNLFKLFK